MLDDHFLAWGAGDDLRGRTVVDGPGKAGDQPGDRQAEVSGKISLGAKEVSNHSEGGLKHVFEQNWLRFEPFKDAGDLVMLGNGGGDAQQAFFAGQALEILSKGQGSFSLKRRMGKSSLAEEPRERFYLKVEEKSGGKGL
jgi:hypothetical protein